MLCIVQNRSRRFCACDRAGQGRSPDPALYKELLYAAGNEYGYVHQHARQGDAAARDEVLGLPMGIELGLVASQPLEVVEVLAVAEHEIADTVPGGRERMAIEARE